MSASNWAVCPFCVTAASQIFPVDESEAEDKYRTVREDYEFYGFGSGVSVKASYSASCTECGASCEFDTAHDIERGDR